jgi:hypothetical protein
VTPRYRFQDDNGYWSCDECGVVVAVRASHDAHHDKLDAADEAAAAALLRTRGQTA